MLRFDDFWQRFLAYNVRYMNQLCCTCNVLMGGSFCQEHDGGHGVHGVHGVHRSTRPEIHACACLPDPLGEQSNFPCQLDRVNPTAMGLWKGFLGPALYKNVEPFSIFCSDWLYCKQE